MHQLAEEKKQYIAQSQQLQQMMQGMAQAMAAERAETKAHVEGLQARLAAAEAAWKEADERRLLAEEKVRFLILFAVRWLGGRLLALSIYLRDNADMNEASLDVGWMLTVTGCDAGIGASGLGCSRDARRVAVAGDSRGRGAKRGGKQSAARSARGTCRQGPNARGKQVRTSDLCCSSYHWAN